MALVPPMLNVVSLAHAAIGNSVMGTVARGAWGIGNNYVPLWNQYMPRGAHELRPPPSALAGGEERKKVVYLPSCVTRAMGPSRGDDDAAGEAVHAKLFSLIDKVGLRYLRYYLLSSLDSLYLLDTLSTYSTHSTLLTLLTLLTLPHSTSLYLTLPHSTSRTPSSARRATTSCCPRTSPRPAAAWSSTRAATATSVPRRRARSRSCCSRPPTTAGCPLCATPRRACSV